MKAFLILFLMISAISNVSAEVFVPTGGSIIAMREGDDEVVITVTGIQATKIVHFRGHGANDGQAYVEDIQHEMGVLRNVTKNGGRFQLKDESGRWMLITQQPQSYTLTGVAKECQKSS